MRKSIFDIELRIDIKEEFDRIIDVIFENDTVVYKCEYFSFIQLLDYEFFCDWKYGATCLSVREYFKYIGVDDEFAFGYGRISSENFLMLLEFLLNMKEIIEGKLESGEIVFESVKLKKVLYANIPLLLEKMNYKIIKEDDVVKIIKRDADVDSIIDIVPENISILLLSYNDVRIENNLDVKSSILKKIDLYIEKEKNQYKGYDNRLYESIQFLVNKLGVNHPQNKKTEIDDVVELRYYYDHCFTMMLHLIRCKKVVEYKNEVDELKSKID